MLIRLIKRVELWRFNKSLPYRGILDEEVDSQQSPDFRQWQQDTREAITVVFGKHSHYLPEFDEIKYSDFLAALSGDEEAHQAAFWNGVESGQRLLESMLDEVQGQHEGISRTTPKASKRIPERIDQASIFIGHGRNPVWARVKLFLQDELKLKTVCYESDSRTGESIVPIMEEMLSKANFAVLILTGEDETVSGSVRARQNVIHEVGLFQSRLGFKRAILLKQEGVEDFTNIAGLQFIPFTENRIEQTFYELSRVLRREGLIQ